MLREVAKRQKPRPTIETCDPHPPILQMLLTGLTPMGCKTPILHPCSKRGGPWTVACQAPPSLGFSRQEHWSRLPFLLQGIFPTQEANLGLLHCRQILYHLSHDESPRILDRVDFLLCSGSSRALEPNLHLLQLRVDSLSPSHLGSPFPSVVSC